MSSQPRLIIFSGGSDDLVGISGAPGCDQVDPDALNGEWNVISLQGSGHPYSGSWEIHSSDGRARVHALYDGCWCFAVGKVDEDDELPAWAATAAITEGPRDYSLGLMIAAPADAVVVGPEQLRQYDELVYARQLLGDPSAAAVAASGMPPADLKEIRTAFED